MERLSKLVCENLISGLWEGLWERIIMEYWEENEEWRITAHHYEDILNKLLKK